MKVALIQMDSTRSRQENERKALKWMEQSAKQRADVICLSESFAYWGRKESSEIAVWQIWKNIRILRGKIR